MNNRCYDFRIPRVPMIIGTILVTCLLIIPAGIHGREKEQITFGQKNTLHSEAFGDEKEYWIHLPQGYDKCNRRYPVMYLTDGDEHFYLASGITEFMSSQFMIPEMIVVAVFHKDRNHDLTPTHCVTNLDGFKSNGAKVSGGGVQLLQFIEKELVPHIDTSFRTDPYRILAGHSLGGLFVAYAYLNSSNVFKDYLSMDPALHWDNFYCERILKALPAQADVFKNRLFISSAQAPNTFRKSQVSFYNKLKAKKGTVQFKCFEKEKHLTVPYQSIYSALSWFFNDYYIFNDPGFKPKISFIQDFYRNISSSYNMEIMPPERLVEMLGKHFLFDKNDYVAAIDLLSFNVQNYPNSSAACEYLATAYYESGKKADAITYFKKSLEINPDNLPVNKILNSIEK